MSLKKKFGTNQKAIAEGVWIEVYDNDDGTVCRFRVRRMNQQNAKFTKELANHRQAFDQDHYSEKSIGQMQASMIEVLCSTVVVDWEFMEDWRSETVPEGFPKGNSQMKLLDFNRDNLRTTLIEFPDMVEVITKGAQDISNFQAKEDDAKK